MGISCVILRLVELHELSLRWYPNTEAKEKNPDAPVYLHTLHPVVRERFTFFFASLRHLDWQKNDTEVVLPFPAPTYLAMYLSMWSSECVVRLMGSVWSHPFELKCCSRSGTNVTSLKDIMHIGLHVAWCPLGVKHFNAVHVHSLAW